MEPPHRPPPVVTVHDPGGQQGPDVLDVGRVPSSRRWLVPVGVLGAVVALGAGALEVRERRAAAQEEQRLRGAVELALLEDRGARVSSAAQGYLLQVELRVRNDGPRPVEVSGASWAGLALVRPVQLPAGRARRVRLGIEVGCGAGRPAALRVDDDVELQVRTASTVRTVRLPLPDPPLDAAGTQRLCDHLPLDERLLLLRQEQALVGGSLLLDGDLSVAGRAPVELVSVEPGPGLAAVLRRGTDGATVRLPVTLPAGRDRTSRAVPYEVVVTVTDCAAARPATGTPGLTVRTGDGQGGEAVSVLPYEPSLHAELLTASCPR